MLLGFPWGCVVIAARMDQRESVSQFAGQTGGIVAGHRQSAALLRAIDGKGPNDRMATGRDGFFQMPDIGGAVGWIDEKMEGRPIMLDMVRLRRVPSGHVGYDPLHLACALTEPRLCDFERGL
jgi:hypothetical protein